MLHGCTQSPQDFAAGTRMNFVAEEQTCFVTYPAQRAETNQAKCWNWFRPAYQQRTAASPRSRITRQVVRDRSVDAQHVYVAGLSAGAAAAVIMDRLTEICTQRSAYIPDWPAVPPRSFLPRCSP